MSETERVINDLNVAKYILCNPKMLTIEMNIRIGQAITNVLSLLKEKEPKAVIITHQNEYCKDGKCPSCGHELDDNMHPKYCGYCGQELKWE